MGEHLATEERGNWVCGRCNKKRGRVVLLSGYDYVCEECLFNDVRDGKLVMERDQEEASCYNCGGKLTDCYGDYRAYCADCSVDNSDIHEDCITGCYECGEEGPLYCEDCAPNKQNCCECDEYPSLAFCSDHEPEMCQHSGCMNFATHGYCHRHEDDLEDDDISVVTEDGKSFQVDDVVINWG